MNCVVFRSKTSELLEDDCLMDFKISMEEHRDNCKDCKSYYEEELEINKDFKQFFSVKDIEFKSSRAEIMNVINKNEYKNNYLIQIYTHFNRHKKKYTTWAAVFVIILLITPNIYKLFETNKINFALGNFSSAKKSSSTASKSVNDENKSTDSVIGENSVNNITFKKLELAEGDKIIPRDTWKNSGDGKYSACIDGKIYVKENNTGKLWSFTVNNDLNQQNTPIFLEWPQKEGTLLVRIGRGAGTLSEGGDDYLLNLDSAIANLIDKAAK